MSGNVLFCLLGPLVVRCGATSIPALPGKQRVLLADLLLSSNRVVSIDELTEALWGPSPPASARGTLRNYVKELRKALSALGDDRISTEHDGYRIRVESGELDISYFESCSGAGKTLAAQGAWEQAASRLREALSLWQGEPLADVPSEWLVAREVPRLAETRLGVLETLIDVELQLGRHDEVIAELRRLTALHPLRERFHARLMLALYRAGHQAEAQAVFSDVRALLVDELGIEPGAELQELHRRILVADPVLALSAQLVQPVASVVPRQLPAAVPNFTGRGFELAALTRMLDRSDGSARTARISAIAGSPGVGKTAIAVHWACMSSSSFPDGQLYVNLRGYDPGEPLAPNEALAGFMRALGLDCGDIPADPGERAACYRSLVAGRKMLVLLDNARSAEQVRPLLPRSPDCAVIVTSRDALAGLVAVEGAQRLDLQALGLDSAGKLLRALIGRRAYDDPKATALLARQCACLPLALRVAAELAASRPTASLADLAGELADHHRRLDLLSSSGDRRTAVRAVFAWSYQQLGKDAATLFRLLGLHPGADIDSYAAAAAASAPVPEVHRVLDILARAYLVDRVGRDRYAMHDLLKEYAAEQASICDAEHDKNAALTRLSGYYLCGAVNAMDAVFPSERHRRPPVPASRVDVPSFVLPESARAWLERERANLVAVAAYTAANGWPERAVLLGSVLFRYLDTGGFYTDAVAIHTSAMNAARYMNDCAAEAASAYALAAVDMRLGQFDAASARFESALALFTKAGDRTAQARALGSLGSINIRVGQYQQAMRHLRLALVYFRQTGHHAEEAHVLADLGLIDIELGRLQQARTRLDEALRLFDEAGDHVGKCYVLNHLGVVCLKERDHEGAMSHFRQALALHRKNAEVAGEAYSLNNLAEVRLLQRRFAEADRLVRESLTIFRRLGDRHGEAMALSSLADIRLATSA